MGIERSILFLKPRNAPAAHGAILEEQGDRLAAHVTQTLGHRRVSVVGHDIGLMVAYAYAAQFPQEVDRVALMGAFLPGVGDWKSVWLLRDLWHFHFYGKTPLALVEGRERIYFEHFGNDFAADPARSV